MKRAILLTSLLLFSSTSYSATYTCYRYANGNPTGTWIKVEASSKSEAEVIAYKRMKELSRNVDYVKCR